MKTASPRLSAVPHHAPGFTAIELLVAIAVLGVLAALAAPGFADILRRHGVESMREEMLGSIALARAEAITRGQGVLMLRTPCPQAANALDWDCGWTVFIDLNGDNAVSAGEPILHTVQGKPGTRIRRSPAASVLSIDRFGQPPIARVEIFPAGAGLTPSHGLLVCLTRAGRVRTVRDASRC